MLKRWRWYLVLPMVVAVSACDSGTGTGEVIEGLDVFQIQGTAQELANPVYATSEPSVSLEDAVSALEDDGLVLDRAAPSPAERRIADRLGFEMGPGLGAVEIPGELLGKTFVYVPSQADWEVDESRTGAPADGIRIIWYETESGGVIASPLVEGGYIDLLDRDTEQLSQVRTTIVAEVAGGLVPVADFLQGQRQTGTGVVTTHFEASGEYSDGDRRVEFDVVSDITSDDATGDEDYSVDLRLSSGDDGYRLRLVGVVEGATTDFDDELLSSFVVDGVETVMDVAGGGSGGQSLETGTLKHAGAVVAEVEVTAAGYAFFPPGGGEFSQTQHRELELLAQIMVFTGLVVLDELPFLY